MIPVMFQGKVFLWTVAEYPLDKLERDISKVLKRYPVLYQIYVDHIPCSSATTLRVPRDARIITIKVPKCLESVVMKLIN